MSTSHDFTQVELGAASSDHDRACEAFAHLMPGVANPRNVGRKASISILGLRLVDIISCQHIDP